MRWKVCGSDAARERRRVSLLLVEVSVLLGFQVKDPRRTSRDILGFLSLPTTVNQPPILISPTSASCNFFSSLSNPTSHLSCSW